MLTKEFFPRSPFRIAGIFPGQAILISRMMDVFTLTGEALKDRGNFFASMFIVLAAGCLVIYFILGYAVNVVAVVRIPVSIVYSWTACANGVVYMIRHFPISSAGRFSMTFCAWIWSSLIGKTIAPAPSQAGLIRTRKLCSS